MRGAEEGDRDDGSPARRAGSRAPVGPAPPGGSGPPGGDLVVFRVPLDPGYVGLVRGVAAMVAASLPDLEEERIDDVRLAVSEACTIVGAIEGPGATGGILALRAWVDGAWARFEVAAAGTPAPSGGAPDGGLDDGGGAERGWGVQLVQTLVDEAEVVVDAAGAVVVLGVRCGPPA